MRAGWKTRIDERRYFEEKKRRAKELALQSFRAKMQQMALQNRVMDESDVAAQPYYASWQNCRET